MAPPPVAVTTIEAMNCDDIKTQLDAYHDLELDVAAATEIAAHVANCPNCAAALDQRRSLGDYLREHGTSAAPDGLWRAIETKAGAATVPTWTAWLLPRLAAAGLGAILVGGAWLVNRSAEQPPRMSETIQSYFRPSDRLVAAPVAAFQDLEELRQRPEQRILDLARTGGLKK